MLTVKNYKLVKTKKVY